MIDSLRIAPSKLEGTLTIPSSKSHTARALFFALMSKGQSIIHRPLISSDTLAMIHAIEQFGAKVKISPDQFLVEGLAGKLQAAEDIIQCRNSGLILRFLGALSALLPSYTVLTGDASIRHRRVILPLLSGLKQLGAFAVSSKLDGFAPMIIRGPIHGGLAKIEGKDSQPVSALLMLGAFAPEAIELMVENPQEKPWIQMTLHWLDRFGVLYQNHRFSHYKLQGKAKIDGFEYTVPGDFSSAAFPLALGLLTDSKITLKNLDFKDVQGDRQIFDILKNLGAVFNINSQEVHLQPSTLKGGKINLNACIDALPILAVIGCFAKEPLEVTGVEGARDKESDRIRCTAQELRKMGAQIEEREDGLLIFPSKLHGSQELQAHHDHRLAMSLTIAALAATSESQISGISSVEKSYPQFFDALKKLGAKIS